MTDPSAREDLTTIGVAFSIPEPWGSFLVACRARAGDPLAPYIPAHLTLLGPTQVPPTDLPAIESHLAACATTARPFGLHLRGTGTFRPVAQVVFVAVVAGISECELLAAAINASPLHHELRFPYHPHVTVAHDVPPASLDTVYEELATFDARFQVDHFTLYSHDPDTHWRPHRNFPLSPRHDTATTQE